MKIGDAINIGYINSEDLSYWFDEYSLSRFEMLVCHSKRWDDESGWYVTDELSIQFRIVVTDFNRRKTNYYDDCQMNIEETASVSDVIAETCEFVRTRFDMTFGMHDGRSELLRLAILRLKELEVCCLDEYLKLSENTKKVTSILKKVNKI